MHVDVSLERTAEEEEKRKAEGTTKKGKGKGKGKDKAVVDETWAAEEFLKRHITAKIVVVINTHCMDSGDFVWAGHDAMTYRVCTLLDVSAPEY